MATKKSIWALFGFLAISAWVFGFAIQVGAETMNYTFYTWVIKSDRVPVGDMEGHVLAFVMRGAFCVFENGEIATASHIATIDYIKEVGQFTDYVTINFADGSTIIIRDQGMMEGTGAWSSTHFAWTSEITHGTGRFEGIKGSESVNSKALPIGKGEIFPKTYGEGKITYTLPVK
jgi:hypothetical protein